MTESLRKKKNQHEKATSKMKIIQIRMLPHKRNMQDSIPPGQPEQKSATRGSLNILLVNISELRPKDSECNKKQKQIIKKLNIIEDHISNLCC